MLFRTEKNIYDIDLVIAVTADKDFADRSGLIWHETDQDVQTGDYYLDGKIIHPGEVGYELIEAIVKEKRDKENEIILANEAKAKEEMERLMKLAEESEEQENKIIDTSILPPIPILDLTERVNLVKRLPPATFVSLFNEAQVPPTPERLKEIEDKLIDTNKMINAIKEADDNEPYLCVFKNPVTFAEGTDHEHTVESVPIPDESLADFLAHWEKVKDDQERYVAHLKNVLGITSAN